MKTIRQYRQEDCDNVERLIVQLQETIASIDPFHRQKTGSDFDVKAYMKKTLERVEDECGAIFVAESDGKIVGCIIGCIPEPSEEDLLESHPVKEGMILELIVAEESRRSGLGSELMNAMETYFKKSGCIFVRVACFAPNVDAHRFYKKCGYGDRNIDMLKKL